MGLGVFLGLFQNLAVDDVDLQLHAAPVEVRLYQRHDGVDSLSGPG